MKPIKLIAMDVDGTLTDGSIVYDTAGVEQKRFHVSDGLGIVMALAAGLRIAVLSGRESEVVLRRMSELGVTEIIQGAGDKGGKLRALRESAGLAREEIAFIGDDINDLPAFEEAGLKIAVADAAELVRKRADFVTARAGGQGAVREACETILQRQGALDEAVARYLETIKTSATRPAN